MAVLLISKSTKFPQSPESKRAEVVAPPVVVCLVGIMTFVAATINTDVVITALAVLGMVGAVGKWLIFQWQSSIAEQQNSPTSTSIIVDASVDVVEVLRSQITTMGHQIETLHKELDNVKTMLEAVEKQRDEWRQRAIDLGWVEA